MSAGLLEANNAEGRRIGIPVSYSYVFEGERFSAKKPYVEFGASPKRALELVLSCGREAVVDGRVDIFGKDANELWFLSGPFPIAIIVEVYGAKMDKGFEPLLERQIHRFLNYCCGLVHMGQRDGISVKIASESIERGFSLRHIGKILHYMFHKEYAEIIERIQVKIYTGKDEVAYLSGKAGVFFAERDERAGKMTDEDTDTFYSCLICQSIAPGHVCIITPERLGLCGSYSWLDAQNSYRIIPSGPNQPVFKGMPLDKRLGQWESVNSFVSEKSSRSVNRMSMYSLIKDPQTSCGLPECVVAVIPEVNGFMVVGRDYKGITPCGMNFSELSDLVCRGRQTPGFLGLSRHCILSKKFISAEGGLRRLVWISSGLKEKIGVRLSALTAQSGESGFLNKVADENTALDIRGLEVFLRKSGHPAVTMPALI